MVEQFRASLNAVVTFSNGGGLRADDFRVDLPAEDTREAEIAALFVASLGLLMTESVVLERVRVFVEPHKGTRGGPSDRTASGPAPAGRHFVELSRSAPADATAAAPGTVLIAPVHATSGEADVSSLPLSALVDLPAVVVRMIAGNSAQVDVGQVAGFAVRGCAVLLQASDARGITAAAATWLAANGAALVGTDSRSVDRAPAGESAAGAILSAAGIPVVAGIVGLDTLPPTGARFTAVPLRALGAATSAVRAFATVPR